MHNVTRNGLHECRGRFGMSRGAEQLDLVMSPQRVSMVPERRDSQRLDLLQICDKATAMSEDYVELQSEQW